jgi:S-formylglutathione hydrolase FrmB
MVITLLAVAAAGCGGEGREASPRHSETYTLQSKVLDVGLDQVVVQEGRGRPLLVLLHGKDGSPSQFFGDNLDSTMRALGSKAPNLLMPSGGNSSYWHNRRDGAWAHYLLNEAIPEAIRRTHADGSDIALGGFGMGGFGALDIARKYPGHFCAAGASTPAIWKTALATAPGAFDSPADFKKHNLIAAARKGWPFGRTRIWIDVNRPSPFWRATTMLAHELGSKARLTVWPGADGAAYVQRHLPTTLRFYADALAACKAG